LPWPGNNFWVWFDLISRQFWRWWLSAFSRNPVHANTINEVVDGPVSAEIVCVIDGDTSLVEPSPWPQQTIEVYV
jgi:hypothetical protein